MPEMKDLKRAFDALSGKNLPLTRYFDYFDGDQPLTYTTKRLAEMFKGIGTVFYENWCQVVISACLDRINLTGMRLKSGAASQALQDWWETAEINLESDSVHEAALVSGEAYLIVWPDPVTNKADAFYNDPRLCHVFYEAENPRRKLFAAKWWLNEDKLCRLTLYYPDRLEYYSTNSKEYPQSAAAFQPLAEEPTAANPFGEVPVFHFTTQRRVVKSDLKNVIPLQDAINKLFTDTMVAEEFAAIPMKYVITDADIQGKLKNAANEVWKIPAGDGQSQASSAGQFPAADLSNFIQVIENLANTVSAISSTPRHFFFGTSGQVSGEALIAMEAPLNRKVQDRIDRFIPEWQAAASLALKMAGKDVDRREIEPIFDEPATVQPRTQAQILQIRTNAGVPLASALRMEGMSDEEIEQVMIDKITAALQEQLGGGGTQATGSSVAGGLEARRATVSTAAQNGAQVTRRLLDKAFEQYRQQAVTLVGGSGA